MSYNFPSAEWVAELERQINSSEEYARAASTWEGDLNFMIEGLPGAEKPIVIYLDLWHGKCREAHITDEASMKAARFRINAPLANWRRVIMKEVGLIPALVSGQLKLHGNLPHILRHVRAAQELVECATRVDTDFPI
ncbi:MAG TPA: SCP2 sterol-binding domain-containing protein [Anaerolineae bacterium]